MKPQEIIFTEKMKSVLADDAQIIILGGATGCSKTIIAGLKMMHWLNELPERTNQCYVIFKDIGTGVRNILQNEDSFYNTFPWMREQYRTGKEGGIQFTFHGINGDTIVYFLGANDKNAWSKILGSNPDAIWLEELSELHIDCVREAFGRAISRRCPLIATTNGGLPSQEFYTEFLNHAVVQYKETVPSVELAEMVEDKPYMHYYHFNLEDDAPHLLDQDKQRLRELYPVNSFYYNSKVLGCRGFVEGAAYAPLMDKPTHLRNFDDINIQYLKEIILSLDIGSNRNPTDTHKASTVATLLGFSKEYQRVVILECWVIPATSHDDIIKQCEALIEWWWVKYMEKFTKIVIDSAESILINTWFERNKFNTVRVKAAVKQTRQQINLITRCTLKQQLLKQERLIWSSRAVNSYNAHTRVLLDENGAELDLAIQDNDIADSLTYGLTENWNNLVRQDRRGNA